jgi:hypothetical protein
LGCNAERRRYFLIEILKFTSYVHRWLFVHVVSLNGRDRVDVLLVRGRVKVVILVRIKFRLVIVLVHYVVFLYCILLTWLKLVVFN